MAPQEVAGLQALALAHGGSLTINPDTGLPEAGFLKKLLPALAGFALNAFAPGFGTAIGGMLGVGGAAGTVEKPMSAAARVLLSSSRAAAMRRCMVSSDATIASACMSADVEREKG
jgi:hypothetical protein